MTDSTRLLDALKRLLKARGLRYADLAQRLGVSTATVKRLLSNGRIGLDRLDEICRLLDTDLFELARAGQQAGGQPRELSLAQEQALAADPRLLAVFHLLCNDWEVPAIRREFELSGPASIRLLARLDRLRLIELQPGDAVRLRVARDFAWRSQGPVRRRYAQAAIGEFLQAGFDGRDALLRFEIKELGDASLAVLRRKLERLAAEFNELANVDASLPGARRHSVGMLLALRPWVFSLMASLKAEGGAAPAGPDPR